MLLSSFVAKEGGKILYFIALTFSIQPLNVPRKLSLTLAYGAMAERLWRGTQVQ